MIIGVCPLHAITIQGVDTIQGRLLSGVNTIRGRSLCCRQLQRMRIVIKGEYYSRAKSMQGNTVHETNSVSKFHLRVTNNYHNGLINNGHLKLHTHNKNIPYTFATNIPF